MTDPIPTTDQWPIGVALILGASFIGGLGDNLIRYSHRKNNTKTPNYFMFIWMVGMFCTIVLNTMCTVAAFAYADSSLILPFAGTHVIFAVVLAIVINNEKVTMKSWLVLSIILFGILTTVIAGNKETINYSLELMMLLFAKPLFLVVASLILIICLLAGLCPKNIGHWYLYKQQWNRTILHVLIVKYHVYERKNKTNRATTFDSVSY